MLAAIRVGQPWVVAAIRVGPGWVTQGTPRVGTMVCSLIMGLNYLPPPPKYICDIFLRCGKCVRLYVANYVANAKMWQIEERCGKCGYWNDEIA